MLNEIVYTKSHCSPYIKFNAQCIYRVRHEAFFTTVKLLKMLNGKVVSYGTITSNGVDTAQRYQTSQQESIKNQSKLHYKPQRQSQQFPHKTPTQ